MSNVTKVVKQYDRAARITITSEYRFGNLSQVGSYINIISGSVMPRYSTVIDGSAFTLTDYNQNRLDFSTKK